MKEKSEKKTEKQSFSFFLFISFVIHGLVVIFFLSSNLLWNLLDRDQKIIIPTAIRVDMVALPDLPSQKKTVQVKKTPVIIPKKIQDKKKKIKKEETKKKQTQKDKKLEKKRQSKKKKSAQKGKSNPNDQKPEANKGNQTG